jgi:hypothetical protein
MTQQSTLQKEVAVQRSTACNSALNCAQLNAQLQTVRRSTTVPSNAQPAPHPYIDPEHIVCCNHCQRILHKPYPEADENQQLLCPYCRERFERQRLLEEEFKACIEEVYQRSISRRTIMKIDDPQERLALIKKALKKINRSKGRQYCKKLSVE